MDLMSRNAEKLLLSTFLDRSRNEPKPRDLTMMHTSESQFFATHNANRKAKPMNRNTFNAVTSSLCFGDVQVLSINVCITNRISINLRSDKMSKCQLQYDRSGNHH